MLLVLALLAPPLLPKESLFISGHVLVNKVANYTAKGGSLEYAGSFIEDEITRNVIPPLLLIDPYTDPKDTVQSRRCIIGKNITKLYCGLVPYKVRTTGEVSLLYNQYLQVVTGDWGGDEYFGGNPDLSALLVNIVCTKISEDKNIASLTFFNSSFERGGKYESLWKLVRSQELATNFLYRQMVGMMAPKQKTALYLTPDNIKEREKEEKERELQREKEFAMDVFEKVTLRFKDWKKECRKSKEAKDRENKRQQKIMLQKQREREKLIKKMNEDKETDSGTSTPKSPRGPGYFSASAGGSPSASIGNIGKKVTCAA